MSSLDQLSDTNASVAPPHPYYPVGMAVRTHRRTRFTSRHSCRELASGFRGGYRWRYRDYRCVHRRIHWCNTLDRTRCCWLPCWASRWGVAVLTLFVAGISTIIENTAVAWPSPSRMVFFVVGSAVVLCLAPLFGSVFGWVGGWTATTVATRWTADASSQR